MKILQVGKFWPVLGGVEKVMYDLTLGLSERGIDCDMLCAATRGTSREIKLNAHGRVMAVRTIVKANSTMISPELVSKLRSIAHNYDIIHVHHPDPMAALALYMSGYKGKVVLHWHSDILRQRILLHAYRPLQNWLISHADVIICTSPNYAAGSKALKRVAHKIEIVPIGVPPVHPDPDAVREIHTRYADRRIVFSVGRMIPYKGFNNLVLAAQHLPDDYLTVIAGSGPLRNSLLRLISDNGLESKVILPGRISDEERDAYMGAASVFCLPSVEKTEAYGIVLIEAMSAGLPVVATRIPGSGTSWVNADGVSGLNAECGSPLALAEAIMRVSDRPSDARKYALGARKRWEDMFTVDRFLDNMSDIYSRLLS